MEIVVNGPNIVHVRLFNVGPPLMGLVAELQPQQTSLTAAILATKGQLQCLITMKHGAQLLPGLVTHSK